MDLLPWLFEDVEDLNCEVLLRIRYSIGGPWKVWTHSQRSSPGLGIRALGLKYYLEQPFDIDLHVLQSALSMQHRS